MDVIDKIDFFEISFGGWIDNTIIYITYNG